MYSPPTRMHFSISISMPGSTPGSPFLPGCSWPPHTPLSWLPQTKNAFPWGLLSSWSTKRSHSVLSRENRHSVSTQWWTFGQKLPSRNHWLYWRIVMVQQPAVVGPQLWHFLAIAHHNALNTLVNYAAVIVCPRGNQCFKIIPQQSKNATIMAFVCDLDILTFFVRGSSDVLHSRLCCCVSWSYAKIQLLSLFITQSKTSQFSNNFVQMWMRVFFCSLVNFWNQFRAHFSHVQFFSKNQSNSFSIYVDEESYLLDQQPMIIFECSFDFTPKDGVTHLN